MKGELINKNYYDMKQTEGRMKNNRKRSCVDLKLKNKTELTQLPFLPYRKNLR